MRHYCTLFDSKYLPQGLALYESLKANESKRFALWILAMDVDCEIVLRDMRLPNARICSREWFERQARFAIKDGQTWQEYCWACASVFTDHLMQICEDDENETFDEFIYLDADCYFFNSPAVIFEEIGARSIAVVPHRLIPSKKHLEINGKYNVSLVYFKNTPNGRECLSTWAAQCRQRCSAQIGCGDQKYVEEFEKYGDDLFVIQNIGVGVAPWNLANYKLTAGPRVDGQPVVFYHYHEYIHEKRLTKYELRPEDREIIYEPYIQAVNRANERIASVLMHQ